MENELFEFQKIGADWLASRRVALLSDSMGLGKSAQAIRAADLIGAQRICVVCPSVARENWRREFEKFSVQDRDFQIVSSQKEEIDSTRSTIISYDLLVSNIFGIAARYDALILDEVHFIKSIEAKRTAAVFGSRGLVRHSSRIWALSATPAPNDVSEMWGLLYTFGATSLKRDEFIDRYCTTIQSNYGLKVTGNKPEMVPELKSILHQVMLRRKKEEVMAQLPPISFSTVVVPAGEVDFGNHASLCTYAYPKDRRDEIFTELKSQETYVKATFELLDRGSPLEMRRG